ncbi:SdrD B-like domain-containing protein [Runella sp.]|uniref:SdrD B-like domain-containing protein n=1 Tax=Runella sp. TaxID=1960881 RepID=UPI002638F69E|nr:SdrD B-like domain-containing protein [Runella sp.]
MKARFTTTPDLETSRNFERKSSTKNTSLGETFWLFLKGAASCIQLILPNRKRAVERNPGYQIPYKPKLFQKGQKAFWVNSVGIDQHYHLPGASPPTGKLYGIRAEDFTQKFTSLQSIISQTMSKLSISPQYKQRVLGARFDEKSRRWVSTSPPDWEGEVNSYESIVYIDSSFPKNRLIRPFKSLMGAFTLVLLTVFTALGQKIVDIKLSKKIDFAQPTIGQSIKFTVYAKNDGPDAATGVIVKDLFPTDGADLTANTPQAGTTFNPATGLWNIPTIASGDSVKLELTGTVTGRGVYFNIVEVMSMDAGQVDSDSNPGNGTLSEDDYATACFSVPILWYPGNEYAVSLSVVGYSNVVWTKVGSGAITGAASDSASVNGDTLIIKGTGRFAFSAQVNACPATGCCEIVVISGPLGSIGDFVWKDVFNNGIQDAGEPGVNGVRVILWSAVGGVPITPLDTMLTTTNPGDSTQGGYYHFDGLLAGNYIVQLDKTTLPLGCILSDSTNKGGDNAKDSDIDPTTGYSQVVTLDPEQGGILKDNPRVDGALFSPLGSIGDYVWKDLNNNGIQDDGNSGVNNVQVVLFQKDQAGAFVPVDITLTANNPVGGALGWYSFESLSKGEYQVKILVGSLPAGCVLSDSTNKGGDDTKDSDFNPTTGLSQIVTLDPIKGGIDKDNPTIDGALRNFLGSIGDYVWKDTDNDGIQDATESGVNGVKVILWSANVSGQPLAKLDSTLTITNGGKQGFYTFSGLLKGDYLVQIVKTTLPAGCVLSDSTNKGGDDTKDSDFNSTTGISPVVKIDPAKSGIDKDNPTIDGALYSPLGSIGDFVWKDRNDNGQQDSGEPGVKNVRVILYKDSGSTFSPIDTTFTGLNGEYLFTNLTSGSYKVLFDPTSLPDTCQLSLNSNQGSDLTDNDADPTTGFSQVVVIDPTKSGINKDNPTIDAAVTNFDLALNKSLAAGQLADVLPGDLVTFTLTVKNEGSMTATNIALTDSLPAGMSLADTDWTAAGQIATLNNVIAGPLAPGATATVDITVKVDANFTGTTLTNFAQIKDAKDKNGNPVKDQDSTPGNGFTKSEDDDDDEPVRVTPLGSIGDFVWKDRNDNGQQDSGEPGVKGVKVILWTGTASGPVAKKDSMLTGTDGKYLFTNLLVGTYYVQFDTKTLLDTCKLSLKPNTGSDVTDSDADPITGITPAVVLTPQKRSDLTIGAGLTTFRLALNKSLAAGQSTDVALGDLVNFTLTVKNEGSMTATAIALLDSLPAGMTLADTDWTVAGRIATLNVPIAGPLAPGATATVDVTVKVDATFAGTTLTNFAQIKDAKDKNGNTVKDKDSILGNGFTKGEDDDDNELVRVKTCTIPPTPTCEDAKNECPIKCVDLTKYVTAPSLPGSRLEWHTGNTPQSPLVADPTKVCTPGNYYVFEVAACGEYSNPGRIVVTIQLCPADLSLTKTVSNKTPQQNDNVTYTIKVTNDGPSVATNVEVTDTLQAGLQYVSGDAAFTLAGTVLTGKIAKIEVAQTITLTFVAKVVGTGTIKNFAQVSKSDQPDQDSSPGNGTGTPKEDDEDNEDIAVVCPTPPTPTCDDLTNDCPKLCIDLTAHGLQPRTPGGRLEWRTGPKPTDPLVADPTNVCVSGYYYLFEVASCGTYSNAGRVKVEIKPCVTDLAVVKSVIEPSPYTVGQTITYSVVASNNGLINAPSVTVNDVLPSLLTFVSANPAAEYNVGTGVWTIGNLAVGANRTLQIRATINAIGTITNTAIVKGLNNDPTKANNDTSTVTIKVDCIKQPEPPVLACATTNFCPGDSTTIYAIGCAGGTIMWSNGAIGASVVVKPTETTTYTAVCNKNGCISGPSNPTTIYINTPTTPVIVVSSSKTICLGSSATLTASNCAGTIVWSTGATGAQIVVTPTETATYTAYCKIGKCESPKASVTINVIPKGETPVVICGTDKVCPGESVTLQVTNCAGIVEWSTGETGPAIVVYPTTTTTYWAVCNNGGCKARSKDYTIKVIPVTPPTVVASPSTTICNGGSVTLTASGCEGIVTWSSGVTGASIVVSPASTTTYTATCSLGKCVSGLSAPVTITVGNATAPTISAEPTLICAGQSTTLTAGGTCDGTILWSNGATGVSITLSPTATTEYTAVCKVGTCESPKSNKVKITVTTAGAVSSVYASKPSICAGESSVLTASGCTGTYVWSTGATGVASITVTPTTTTTYSVSCRVNGKCDSAPGYVTVTVDNISTPPTITVSPSSTVCAGSTVKLTAASCKGGTISWSTGATGVSIDVVVNATTTYTAKCTIGKCESAPGSATVTVVPTPEKPIVICSTDKVCPSESVTLQVKNCAGTVYWSTGEIGPAIVIHPTVTTTYTAKCKVGDCTSPISADYTIKVYPVTPPTVSAAPAVIQLGETSVLTATGCDGEITWSNGKAGASIVVTPTVTTSYTAVCKVGACTSQASIPVTVKVIDCKAPSISADAAVVCEGGSVKLTATGCEGGTINWSNGATGNSITVNPLGITTYTAVCKKGDCTSDASNAVTVVVTKVYPPTILCSTKAICKGETVSIKASGCEGTVLWSNGATGVEISVTPETTTTYTVKCKVGNCESAPSSPLTIVVGVPAAPTVQASKTNLCYGESVTLTALTACSGYIQWSNGQVGSSITIVPAASTIYVAYCCNNASCKSVASNTLNVIVAPKVKTPEVVSLANVCPVKTVDLATAVKNYTTGAGLVLEFHEGNTPGSPTVANPLAVGVSGTYYAFFRSTVGCYSEGVAIHVLISPCETTPCETNPATADAGGDAAICAAIEYKLNGKIGGVATSAIWSTNGTGKFSNPLALDATYYPSLEDLIKGEVMLTLTTNDPDGSGKCVAGKDDLKLIFEGIKFRPQIIVNGTLKADTLPQTITICQGDTVKLKASEQDYQVKWFKDGKVLFPASDGIRQWNVTEPGTYAYALVDVKRCCSVPSAYITVVVKALPTPIVKNLRNTCPSTTVDLTTALEGNGTYTTQFRSAAQLACTCLVGTPEAVGGGTYYVVYKKDGCYSAPAAIEVKIFDCATDTLRSDLSINKTANKAVALVGENVTYKIVVKNNGQHKATNVDVRDIMPSELEVVSTSGMTNTGGVLTTRIASLTAGSSDTLTVVAKAKKPGNQVTNKVAITYADQVDPNGSNNQSSVSIVVSDGTVSPAIGVALAVDNIVKKGDGADVSYDVTYKITVKNVGNIPLTGVQVVDSITGHIGLPATFTVVGAPTVNAGSTLVPNGSYNGTSDKNILGSGSSLAVGAENVVLVTINIKPNGNTGLFLGSVVASGNGSGTPVKDASNKGTVVNAPVDNSTPVRFDLPSALIGLSKSAGRPIVVGDGKFKIPYTISITNLGTSDLKKIQVKDDLGLTFGSKAAIVGKPLVTADGGLTVDSTYTGQGLLTNLLVDSLSTLPKGATRSINLAVIVSLYNPDSVTKFYNIAIGTGLTQGGVATADTSTTGDNVDPDNDLDPRNNSESTPVSLNSTPGKGLLGLAMSIKDTLRKGDGSLNITYRVILKNYGAGVLTNVQVSDSLTKVYSSLTGASYQLVGTPTANDSSSLRINPGFDGDRDVNLLLAQQSRLAGGRTDSLFFTINVTNDGRLTPYLNRALGSALAGQNSVTDLSTNGLVPDLNGDNDPTGLTEAEFTPIVITSDGGLFIPEGFSPNADGINDKFVIRHPSGTKIVLEIYNRWMNLVYRNNDYQNDWEGGANVGVANNNQGVPAGTYFYNVILQDQNGGEIKKSSRFMTINR